MSDEVVVKDFSRKRSRIVLQLDGEEYEARPAIGLKTLQRVQAIQRKFKDPELDKIDLFAEMFGVLLKTDDAARFAVKLADEDEPVDPDQLQEMVSYVMERNGGRPTGESVASASGSFAEVSGTPSTDGASVDA
jgi:hypothetical protein